jgi:hypothetical protein
MLKIYAISLLLIFSSCRARLNYLGSSYTPSKHVEVFVDPSAIKKPYTVMGKGYMEFNYYTKGRISKMQAKAIETAKQKGADAVLFHEYFVTQEGTNVKTVTKTDSVGKGSITVHSGTIGPIVSSRTDILFLKYN